MEHIKENKTAEKINKKENVSVDSSIPIKEVEPIVEEKINHKKVFLILIFLLFLALSGYLSYDLVWKKQEPINNHPEKETKITSTPFPKPTVILTVVETKTLNRKDLKINVLNGTDIKGVAAKTKDFLLKKGYEDIEIGNAESEDFKQTEISIKEEKKDFLEILSNDLKSDYKIGTKSANLDKNSQFDVIIIVGKK